MIRKKARINLDCNSFPGWEKAGKLKNFLAELSKHVNDKSVVLYGGNHSDKYEPDFEEVAVTVNNHYQFVPRSDVNITYILRLANPYYPGFHIFSGILALRCLLDCSPVTIHMVGFDFYLARYGKVLTKVGSHPVRENFEIFKDLIADNRVSLSDKTKAAVRTLEEYYDKGD